MYVDWMHTAFLRFPARTGASICSKSAGRFVCYCWNSSLSAGSRERINHERLALVGIESLWCDVNRQISWSGTRTVGLACNRNQTRPIAARFQSTGLPAERDRWTVLEMGKTLIEYIWTFYGPSNTIGLLCMCVCVCVCLDDKFGTSRCKMLRNLGEETCTSYYVEITHFQFTLRYAYCFVRTRNSLFVVACMTDSLKQCMPLSVSVRVKLPAIQSL